MVANDGTEALQFCMVSIKGDNRSKMRLSTRQRSLCTALSQAITKRKERRVKKAIKMAHHVNNNEEWEVERFNRNGEREEKLNRIEEAEQGEMEEELDEPMDEEEERARVFAQNPRCYHFMLYQEKPEDEGFNEAWPEDNWPANEDWFLEMANPPARYHPPERNELGSDGESELSSDSGLGEDEDGIDWW